MSSNESQPFAADEEDEEFGFPKLIPDLGVVALLLLLLKLLALLLWVLLFWIVCVCPADVVDDNVDNVGVDVGLGVAEAEVGTEAELDVVDAEAEPIHFLESVPTIPPTAQPAQDELDASEEFCPSAVDDDDDDVLFDPSAFATATSGSDSAYTSTFFKNKLSEENACFLTCLSPSIVSGDIVGII